MARLHDKRRQTFADDADQVLDYYANDTFFHDTFQSCHGLRASLGKAEQLLATLTQAGLNANDDKTQVLLKLGGSETSSKYIKARSTFAL